MQFYEYLDLVFIVKCLKSTDTTSNFQVSNFLNFSKSSTQSSTFTKFILNKSRTNFSRHFYFNRVAHLWNLLPQLDLNLTISTIKSSIKETLWADFLANFNSKNPCSFHMLCPCNTCRSQYPPVSNFSN